MTEGKISATPKGWTRWLLFGSLTLNLLFVGVGVGGVLSLKRHVAGGAPPANMQMLTVGPLSRALTPEDRDEVLDFVRSGRNPDIMSPRDMRADGVLMMDTLRGADFDPAVLEAIFQRQNASDIAMQGALQQALLQRLSQMTPDERNALADRLTAAFERSHRAFGRAENRDGNQGSDPAPAPQEGRR